MPKLLVAALDYKWKGAQGMPCALVDCSSLHKGQVKTGSQIYVHGNLLRIKENIVRKRATRSTDGQERSNDGQERIGGAKGARTRKESWERAGEEQKEQEEQRE